MDSKITDAYLNLYNKKGNSKKVRMTNLYEQVVSGQTLEEAKLTLTFDDGTEEEVEVSGNEIKKIAGYFKGEVEGSFMSKKDIEVINILSKKAGFDSQDKFLKILFKEYDVDYSKLQKFVEDKDSLNVLGEDLSGLMGEVDLFKICYPQMYFLNKEEEKKQFYNQLFVRKFEEGVVSVGAGELALAVLTEAKKGRTGDLELPKGLQIEVKTGMGRVISARGAGFANDRKLINGIATGEINIDQVNPAEDFNSKLCKKAFSTEVFKNVVNYKEPELRKDFMGALLLYEYGNQGNLDGGPGEQHGFNILLAVYQKGFQDRKTKPDQLDKGTFFKSNYVNVGQLSSVINAVENGMIKFKFDGEGVYIYYPGSNTSVKFAKDFHLV